MLGGRGVTAAEKVQTRGRRGEEGDRGWMGGGEATFTLQVCNARVRLFFLACLFKSLFKRDVRR